MADIRIKKDITENDFTCNFVHTSNQEFIHEIVLKYGLSSQYPQKLLCKYKMPLASKLVYIKGTEVHIILSWYPNLKKYIFGLWAFPNEVRYVNKFSIILDIIYDIHKNRNYSL